MNLNDVSDPESLVLTGFTGNRQMFCAPLFFQYNGRQPWHGAKADFNQNGSYGKPDTADGSAVPRSGPSVLRAPFVERLG